MHWEILIIPLIALGVWILGTLFKSEDEKTRKSGRRLNSASPRPPVRRPVTNLEQFLEEARRRREAEERAKAPPAPPPARAPISRPPLRERPPRPAQTPRVAPAVIRREEAPVAVPVARPVASAEVVEAAVPPLLAPYAPRPEQPSPIVQQARALLSKPQTAATAFVLREIFDRPLSRRRR